MGRVSKWLQSLLVQPPKAGYEVAKPTRLRKLSRDNRHPDALVMQGAVPARNAARDMQRNHDIGRGALRTLVNNVVGANGIGIEPQPRRADGSIHTEYAEALRELWRDWCRMPEVSGRFSWSKCQRMAAATWLRDGEAFAQLLAGKIAFLDHGTRVPFSLELFEPDMVPLDFDDASRNIRQGIQCNAWGRATGYHVYRQNPNDVSSIKAVGDTKYISADRMLHLAAIDRIHQRRGVSEFASVMNRLADIKDYEDSERIAAKIAASLTMYVKRGSPDMYEDVGVSAERDEHGERLPRELGISPGMIIDSLEIGEEIGMIDSNRPNPNLVTFRQGQLRAAAAGFGTSYSSMSRDYSGTYSSQRQELVEQWVHYAVLADDFVGGFVRPVWEQFVAVCDLSGIAPVPKEVVRDTADNALFIAQSMPWIDPVKEAVAWETLVKAGFASEPEVHRKRGVNPKDVLDQTANFRQESARRGLKFSSNAAMDAVVPVSDKELNDGAE
jgi:lambda family phage portal protein